MDWNPDRFSADYHERQSEQARADRGEPRYVIPNGPRCRAARRGRTAMGETIDHENARQLAEFWTVEFQDESEDLDKLARAYLDLRARLDAYFKADRDLSVAFDWGSIVPSLMESERALRACLSPTPKPKEEADEREG